MPIDAHTPAAQIEDRLLREPRHRRLVVERTGKCRARQATARYMAPVLHVYSEGRAQTARATVPLPAPEVRHRDDHNLDILVSLFRLAQPHSRASSLHHSACVVY